jgi:site-specific DNA-cytosine methylase
MVPERFFLSPRAAAGILRRAARRGRALPGELVEALRLLANELPEQSSLPGLQGTGSAPTRLPEDRLLQLWIDDGEELTTTRLRLDILSLPVASPRGNGSMGTPRRSLRRLTPTERERLQGLPDSWTLLPTGLGIRGSGMRSPSRSLSGLDAES